MRSSLVKVAKEIFESKYPDATVLFLAGSIVRGEGTPHSDLDLVVIFDKLNNAYRESFHFQGFPVEAFVHDPETLNYFLFEVDRPTGVPALAQMILEGIELPEPNEVSQWLKQLGYATFAAYDVSEALRITAMQRVNAVILDLDMPGAHGSAGGISRRNGNAFATTPSVDLQGNVYIADEGSNRIRKVNTAGIISTIAGNGKQGFDGDGGPATSASLYEPSGVAVDPAGNVYIADAGSLRIRKVDTAGTISTIAGNGQQGFNGDGGPATSASYAVIGRSNGLRLGREIILCVSRLRTWLRPGTGALRTLKHSELETSHRYR